MSEKCEKIACCKQCKWWNSVGEISGIHVGECRQGAPGLDHANGRAWWPQTIWGDMCGSFEYHDDRAARLLGTKYMNRSKGEAA